MTRALSCGTGPNSLSEWEVNRPCGGVPLLTLEGYFQPGILRRSCLGTEYLQKSYLASPLNLFSLASVAVDVYSIHRYDVEEPLDRIGRHMRHTR